MTSGNCVLDNYKEIVLGELYEDIIHTKLGLYIYHSQLQQRLISRQCSIMHMRKLS